MGRFFYVNPPYSAKTDPPGLGIMVFVDRCLSMCAPRSSGCIILPYDPTRPWTLEVNRNVQKYLLEVDCCIREKIDNMHSYYLDDDPNLRSSTITVDRLNSRVTKYEGKEIARENLRHFYGSLDMTIPEFIDENGKMVFGKCHNNLNYNRHNNL